MSKNWKRKVSDENYLAKKSKLDENDEIARIINEIDKALEIIKSILNSSTNKKFKLNDVINRFERIKESKENFNCEKLKIGLFGGPGSGKSFLINQMINKELLSTKSGGNTEVIISQGCTQYPIKCSFRENEAENGIFVIKTFKEETLVKTFKKKNTEEVLCVINDINNKSDDSIDYVEISLPFDSNLKNIEFIDFIGVPDQQLLEKAHARNSKAIILNDLDIAFILKRDSNDRGTVLPKDLIELDKSDIFKQNYNLIKNIHDVSPPKIVSVWPYEITPKKSAEFKNPSTYYKENQERYKNYLMKSLNILSKKKTSQELENKLRNINDESFKEFENQEVQLSFKNTEFKELQNRLDSLLYFPTNHQLREYTVSGLDNIINETLNYKRAKQEKKWLRQLLFNNTILKNEFYSLLSKREDGEIFRFLNTFKNTKKRNKENKLEIRNQIKKFLNEISSNKSDVKLSSTAKAKQYELIKEKFIEKICTIFNKYIQDIKNFIENCSSFNMLQFNSSINEIFIKESLEVCLKETEFDDSVKLESFLLDKYDSIKNEIYYEEANGNNNANDGIRITESNEKLIKTYLNNETTFDFDDHVNEPKLFCGEKKLIIPNSDSIFKTLKPLNTIDKIKKLKSENLLAKQTRHDNARYCIENAQKLIRFNVEFKEMDFLNNSEPEKILNEINFNFFQVNLNIENKKFILKFKNKANTNIQINSLKEKLCNYQESNNSPDRDIVLHPIFISIDSHNLFELVNNNNLYALVKDINKTENNLIILVIQYPTKENIKLFKQLLESIFSASKNTPKSTIVCFLEENLPKGNKSGSLTSEETVSRKIYTFLIAKYFKLDRYYVLNDRVKSFYEYSNSLEDFKYHKYSAIRALNYLSKVLTKGILSEDENVSLFKFAEDDEIEIDDFISLLFRTGKIDREKRKLLKDSVAKSEREKLRLHLNNLRETLNADQIEEYNKIMKIVSGSKIDYLSEISLVSLNYFYDKNTYTIKNQLNNECNCRFTHKQEKPKYNDVILYNTKALERILPVNLTSSDDLNTELFFYYKLINTICGYVCYYFAYENQPIRTGKFISLKTLLEIPLPILEIDPNANGKTNEYNIPDLKVKSWTEFDRDLNKRDFDDVFKKYSIPNIDLSKRSFRYESELQDFVLDIFRKVFSDNLLIYENNDNDVNYKFQVTGDINDTDLVFVSNNKRLIDIELKNENVFACMSKRNQSLYDYYISPNKQNSNPKNSLHQIFSYIKSDSLKYGVLSSYNNTWYLKYEGDTLYISKTYMKDMLLKSMYHIIQSALS